MFFKIKQQTFTNRKFRYTASQNKKAGNIFADEYYSSLF